MKLRSIILLSLLSIGACECQDVNDGWQFTESFPETTVTADVRTEDIVIVPPDMGPVEIVPDVPIEYALNERTGLTIDDAGTVYLAYHSCNDETCSAPILTLARRPRGGSWSIETVKEQQGTFGVDVAQNGEPILAFLDHTDNTFKSARRIGRGEFEFVTFGVRRTSIADGLDIARDGDRMFVTFANERGDPVSSFIYDNSWRSLVELDIGFASAALERGLRADGDGNLYLVHQQGDTGPWGIARFDLSAQAWTDLSYFQTFPALRVSSLVVEGDELCMSHMVDETYLAVTCGDITSLDRQRWDFADEPLSSYSSLIRGGDALYVAFNGFGNTELRLGRYDGVDWSFSTLFERNSYGVSTIVDLDGFLLVSYYTCSGDRCSLEVLSRHLSEFE